MWEWKLANSVYRLDIIVDKGAARSQRCRRVGRIEQIVSPCHRGRKQKRKEE